MVCRSHVYYDKSSYVISRQELYPNLVTGEEQNKSYTLYTEIRGSKYTRTIPSTSVSGKVETHYSCGKKQIIVEQRAGLKKRKKMITVTPSGIMIQGQEFIEVRTCHSDNECVEYLETSSSNITCKEV